MGGAAENDGRESDRLAEREVIGAVLVDEDALPRLEGLDPEDFGLPLHGAALAAARAVAARGEAVCEVTVRDELRQGHRLAPGDAEYLGGCATEYVTSAHLEANVKTILKLARPHRRGALLERAAVLDRAGHDSTAVRAQYDALAAAARPTLGIPVGEFIGPSLRVMRERAAGLRPPVATPWPAVNALLRGGLRPGVHYLVSGTGFGKTQWSLQLAHHVARAGRRVVYVGLEMKQDDLTARLVAIEAGTAWSDLYVGADLAEHDRVVAIAEASATALPMVADFAPPNGWRAERLDALARAHKPALIVLDYLQIVGGNDSREDARQRIARAAYLGQHIGDELGIAVLAVSSTPRERYADLIAPAADVAVDPESLVGLGKETGEIEYSGVTVMVIGREASDRRAGRWLCVAKQRAGDPGVVPLAFDGHRFTEPVAAARRPLRAVVGGGSSR